MSQCPGHQDDKASLHITETRGGTLLLKCHAGCDNRDVVKAWGLGMKDLFPTKDNDNPPKQDKRVIAVYDYKDSNDKLIFQNRTPRTQGLPTAQARR